MSQVNFLSKLVALRPGKTVQKMISDVMHGKEEGADNLETGDDEVSDGRQKNLSGVAGRVRLTLLRPSLATWFLLQNCYLKKH